MILLDIIFKICYGPFQKSENGRVAAIIWLMPILGFTLLGIINILVSFLGIDLSPIVTGFLGLALSTSIYFLFHRIYVEDLREIGRVKYPILMGALIPILIVISIIFMSISLAKY